MAFRHGTAWSYRHGCHCESCTAASVEAKRRWRERKRRGVTRPDNHADPSKYADWREVNADLVAALYRLGSHRCGEGRCPHISEEDHRIIDEYVAETVAHGLGLPPPNPL